MQSEIAPQYIKSLSIKSLFSLAYLSILYFRGAKWGRVFKKECFEKGQKRGFLCEFKKNPFIKT